MAGRHVILDASASLASWPDGVGLRDLLLQSAIKGNATPLDSRVILLPTEQSRPGSPPGGTAWVGLDESHITLHWYLEENRVLFALDVFTCGYRADPEMIVNEFQLAVGAAEIGERVSVDRFRGRF